MNRPKRYFACILAVLCMGVPAIVAQEPIRDTATVAEVLNGTSFMTASGEKIEMLGVRSPRSVVVSEYEVKQYLYDMIGGKKVVLFRDTTLRNDWARKHQRYVVIEKINVNLQMLKDGYVLQDEAAHHLMRERFNVMAAEAKAMERGVWKRERSRPVRCSQMVDGDRCTETTTSRNGRCYRHQ